MYIFWMLNIGRYTELLFKSFLHFLVGCYRWKDFFWLWEVWCGALGWVGCNLSAQPCSFACLLLNFAIKFYPIILARSDDKLNGKDFENILQIILQHNVLTKAAPVTCTCNWIIALIGSSHGFVPKLAEIVG